MRLQICKLELEQFICSMEICRNEVFSLFPESSGSIASDIPSLADHIRYWKGNIYASKADQYVFLFSARFDKSKAQTQNWLDNKGVYPATSAVNE